MIAASATEPMKAASNPYSIRSSPCSSRSRRHTEFRTVVVILVECDSDRCWRALPARRMRLGRTTEAPGGSSLSPGRASSSREPEREIWKPSADERLRLVQGVLGLLERVLQRTLDAERIENDRRERDRGDERGEKA